MAEGKIDALPIKDFSEKPRVGLSFVGEENAAIRRINPNDREDMQRYREMDRLLSTMPEFSGKPLADRTLIDLIRNTQPGKTNKRTDRYLFGVAATKQLSEEGGELQGCIALYPNEEVPELIKQKLLQEEAKNEMVLEVTVVKKPGAQERQIASALRQVCEQVSSLEGAYHVNDETIKPKIYVTANVRKENKNSMRMLENACFERKGSVTYYEGDAEYDFYVLNWEKLNAFMHGKADSYWQDKLKK